LLSFDLDRASGEAMAGGDSYRAGRNTARALFAFVEGTVYGMKQTAYEVNRALDIKVFNHAEEALLREEEYGLGDKGKVKVRSARLRAEPNLRFAFDAFARAFKCEPTLRLEGEDRVIFVRAVKIRDRLTHPKKASELRVSSDELIDLLHVRDWFVATLGVLIKRAYERLDKPLKEG